MLEHIIKAEILWSRKCSLQCSYCRMATGEFVKKDINQWREGVNQLLKFNCRFMPIYGAEPLDDFDYLPDFINYLKKKRVLNTIITSGISKDFKSKLKQLVNAGLESLSTSYDITGNDKYSSLKGDKAYKTLDLFKEYGKENAKDLAIIMTLTRFNFKLVPEVIRRNTKKNIWTLFDFLHYDRGQPKSKTRNTPETFKLLFTDSDLIELKKVLLDIIDLKEKGYLVHQSKSFFKFIIDNINIVKNLSWNCAKENNFPAWVTVNYDAEVFPCDDFQPSLQFKMYIDEIEKKWENFKKIWRPLVQSKCPGCCWNTHIDAHLIKRNKENFEGYVHGRNY